MCAICGAVRVMPPAPVDAAAVLAMRDAMVHRGPDDEGVVASGNAALGVRRLAIIDLAGGHQPMASDDGDVWLAYNGEIYNFRELRAELEASGHSFRTKSDSEVVLRAWEAFGTTCVERLRGMFAFAIWDGRRRELLLARDRLGIKPLYYTMADGVFLFASEIKAILRWPGVERTIDLVALRHYLGCRYVPGPRTLFRGIRKLEPGHVLILHADGRLVVRQYWDLPIDAEPLADREAAERLRALLEECVRMHLVGDVPLGVFLSGGLDSTAVTGLTARLTSEPVQTFSVGYDDAAGLDERAWARLGAERFRTVHRDLTLDAGEFWRLLPRLTWYLDEPVADPAAVPLYCLAQFAREFVTVALSGEGADEILAGYGIYPRMLWLQRVGRLPGLSLARAVARGRTLTRYLGRATRPLPASYRGVSGAFAEDEIARVLAPELVESDDDDFAAPYFERTRSLDPLSRMLYLDLKVWLPDDLLLKADKMTMAASVELRVPFLDHELVEWSWRLHPRLKLKGRTGKHVLRQATADLVPPEIRARPKQGFAIPVSHWLRRRLGAGARALLTTNGSRRLFRTAEVERLIARHESGREDLAEPLFTLIALACWYRVFVESRAVDLPPAPEVLGA